MIAAVIHRCIRFWLILGFAAYALADDSNLNAPQPDPGYSPADVVSIQMNALKNNDTPYDDAGIEITFRFASPSNKANTGPLERFKTLFDNSDYTAMIGHKSLEIGPIKYFEDSASVPIFILSKQGEKIPYLFKLDKLTQPPYENCWMTSAVIRIPTPATKPGKRPIQKT